MNIGPRYTYRCLKGSVNVIAKRTGAAVLLRASGCAAMVLSACTVQPAPVAMPLVVPAARTDRVPACGIQAMRETLLREVNAARARGTSCGNRRMPPAPPLAWNDALASAAARHSADMARRDYFSHASPEGGRVGARVTAEGYPWRTVGENIAGGDRSVEVVTRGWMDSPGHCANIMNPEFVDIGAACAEGPRTTWGTYWTMVLGRRR